MNNPTEYNSFLFEEVRSFLDKSVVKITPINCTPTNADEYPMFVNTKIESSLQEWVEDNY
tara:strand:+ start:525 stop:704 length:180 start_codon:yes stop_codon:yes gene_type:complete